MDAASTNHGDSKRDCGEPLSLEQRLVRTAFVDSNTLLVAEAELLDRLLGAEIAALFGKCRL